VATQLDYRFVDTDAVMKVRAIDYPIICRRFRQLERGAGTSLCLHEFSDRNWWRAAAGVTYTTA